jgi:hypothetical protein
MKIAAFALALFLWAAAGATAKTEGFKLCGSFTSDELRTYIAEYSATGIKCQRALNLVLAARAAYSWGGLRSVELDVFKCTLRAGEAEEWYLCIKPGKRAWGHALSY